MTDQKTVGVFIPGLEGGVDEATHHLYGSGDSDRYRIHIYETKGLDGRRAPLVFGRMLATVILHRVTGRLDGAHINMSFRGSTIRKTIIGLLLAVLRVPYVVQIHSGGYRGWWANLGKRPRAAVRAMTGRAERVAVLGEVFLPVATQDFGIPADRAIVMPNAVPSATIEAGQAIEAGRPSASVLYLGRLHRDKGTFDLIDALATLADLDWSATLAGNDQVTETRAAVGAAGLADRITVLDWVDRAEATRLAENATIFALPSYNEAMSMSLLEAMAQGMACIATNVGAHGDVLANGENALVVEPGSVDELAAALRTVITEPETRRRLGQNASELVAQRYQTTAVRAQWEQLYDTVF